MPSCRFYKFYHWLLVTNKFHPSYICNTRSEFNICKVCQYKFPRVHICQITSNVALDAQRTCVSSTKCNCTPCQNELNHSITTKQIKLYFSFTLSQRRQKWFCFLSHMLPRDALESILEFMWTRGSVGFLSAWVFRIHNRGNLNGVFLCGDTKSVDSAYVPFIM